MTMTTTDSLAQPPPAAPGIQLLQADVDPDRESQLRLLVDGSVRYMTVEQGLDADDLVASLPRLPGGDWNTARIARDGQTGAPHVVSATREKLHRVSLVWHRTVIDHRELELGEALRPGVYRATSPRFPDGLETAAVVKLACFPRELPAIERETTAYMWIEGHDIGPPFLGHVAEDGRVVGFAVAFVPDCRAAAPRDLRLCRDALGKLHGVGLLHGALCRRNFLVHRGGAATLIDFGMSHFMLPAARRLKMELEELPAMLEDDDADEAGTKGFRVNVVPPCYRHEA